jgi:galactose mutarotase-like enzyme
MLTIENNYLRISVQKTGAELCSLFDKTLNKEFMWQADSTIWGSFAPILFPIIGCLKDNEYFFESNSYTIPKHGFIRNNSNLKATILNKDTIEFRYKFDKSTLAIYPFKFEFILHYILIEKTIKVEHTIINHDPQNPMFYSVGGHPGLQCPFFDNETYSDYFIEFENEETDVTWQVTKEGLISNESIPFLNNTNRLDLHPTLFKHDALIFKNLTSRMVILKSDKHSIGIQIDYKDFNYLGIWAKPNAPFVCIEPWLGISDTEKTNKDFTQKEGIQKLDGGKSNTVSYSITLLS